MNKKFNQTSNKKGHKKMVTSILSASILSLSLGSMSFAATSSVQDLNGVTGQEQMVKLHAQSTINRVSNTTIASSKTLTQAQASHMIEKAFHVKSKAAHPNQKISRERYIDEVMTALQTAGNMPAIDVITPHIKDMKKLNPSFLGSVQVAIVLGIVKLDHNQNVNPKKEITRAEANVILNNAIGYLKKIKTDKAATPKDKGVRIDVLPNEKKVPQPQKNQNNEGMVSESYATPSNGETLYVRAVKMALDQYAGKDVKYFVAIDLFSNGTPLDTNSKEVQAEVKRLQELNYDVNVAKAWTYEGNAQKVDYTYVGAYLTADQLQHFKVNSNYGYAFQFASNGDGSPVTGQAGSITGVSDNSNLAD